MAPVTRHVLSCNILGTVPSLLQVVRLATCPSQRLDGRGVDMRGGHTDQLAFGIAQCSQAASVDAAGVDVDGVPDPCRVGDGQVPPDDDRVALVRMGPVGEDLESEFIPLAGRRAKQGDVARPRRVDAVEVLRQARMRDHQVATVQDEVWRQSVQELTDKRLHLLARRVQLLQRMVESIADPDRGSLQCPEQLVVVIAEDGEGSCRNGPSP